MAQQFFGQGVFKHLFYSSTQLTGAELGLVAAFQQQFFRIVSQAQRASFDAQTLGNLVDFRWMI